MKLDVQYLGKILKEHDYDYFSAVPCSFLADLINYAINEAEFIMSNNEGDAVASCAGAFMGGRKSVVLMQNSGLTNALSPLSSLNHPFRIPVLGFVSLRGETGLNDEPQHELMGRITEKMLELLDIQWEYLCADPHQLKQQFQRVDKAYSENRSFFFIVKKGLLDKVILGESPVKIHKNAVKKAKSRADACPGRLDVMETLHKSRTAKTLLLASTGKAGRELYEVEDAPGNLYMVGSMGCISSFALGLAMNTPKEVIAIDGDGSLLMRLGNLATNGHYAPANMLHILIDNNMHDSTGGQFTVSHNVDFVEIAAASGYSQSIYIHDLLQLEEEIVHWRNNMSLTFMYVKIRPGSKENLGRPKMKPYEIKERLRKFIHD